MKKSVSILLIVFLLGACVFATIAGGYLPVYAASSPGTINAESAVIVDQGSGKALWRKDSKTRRNPASTTKIMTALLAVENCNLKDTVTVGPEIGFPESDASMADLAKGERITVENLLKGLMLPSGADAAYALAVYTARKVSKNPKMEEKAAVGYFCGLMNKRAVKAGAKSTHFSNPDGYQAKDHYSTASDLALIARAAMKYKQFKSIVTLQSYSMKQAQAPKGVRTWKNTNKLLDKTCDYFYKYITGIKTGYTSDAGHCLVSGATKGGKNIIVVVLDSTTNGVWTDSIKLLDYGLGN